MASPRSAVTANTGRVVAIGTVAALIGAGLTAAFVAAPATAAVAPPSGAETFTVSQTTAGASGDPFLTSDGQRVFFASTAGDLVPGDANGVSDVFVSVAAEGSADPFSGTAMLVSAPDGAVGATRANGPSTEPVATADGRYVAFTSAATNLVAAGGTAGRTSIYVRDTLLDRTFRVDSGTEPDADSYDPDMTDDGRYLVFTSMASDILPDGGVGGPSSFVADLDANGDGVFGDLTVRRLLSDEVLQGTTQQARISGNGATILVTTVGFNEAGDATNVYRTTPTGPTMTGSIVANHAHSPTIDATGDTFAYIGDIACSDRPAVVATTLDGNFYRVALGTIDADRRVGYISDPVISADGSHVVWETTVPAYDYDLPDGAPELSVPVVREQEIGWRDASTQGDCSPSNTPDWVDLAEGTQPVVSASGRTVAFAASGSAASTVFAMDTHINDGLAVTSTQGQLVNPGFMTAIEIASVPLSSLRGYASAVANAPIHNLPIHNLPIHNLPIHNLPIHNLPIHNLPIHNLPIHNLPIHNLPIHNLDFPGGWADVLAGSPFAGELIQTVTLNELIAWAAEALADGSTATPDEIAAAKRIQSLTLGDLGLDDSALSALSLASYVLGTAPIGSLEIAGASTATATERWQALVKAQGILDAEGLPFQIQSDWYLADLDAAGLDIERSGIADVSLASLPVDQTLMGYLPMSELYLAGTPLGSVDASALTESARTALFGTTAVAGTLAAPSPGYLDTATVADLAPGAPESVTLGILFMSLLDAQSYPWEQISASSLDPYLAETGTSETGCEGNTQHCGRNVKFQFTFDPGPGEPDTFAAPTASITTPAGTRSYREYTWGSGPAGTSQLVAPYTGPIQRDGATVRIPMPETAGGTVMTLLSWYSLTSLPGESSATGELTSGTRSASLQLFGDAPLQTFDDPTHNLVNGVWESFSAPMVEGQVYYEWISPAWRDLNDEGEMVEGAAQDEDYYLVAPPKAGERLVVSTNATDGQISLSLYAPQGSSSTLGAASAGPAPGTLVTEQSGTADQPAEAGADAGVVIDGQTLLDQAVVGGDSVAEVEAASTDAAPGDKLLVRVTSGNGDPSAALYSLRVQYVDEQPERQCTAWSAPQSAAPGIPGASDPVTDTTNTLYLFDQQRYGDTYGATAATEVRAALESLTGTGHVGSGAVDGAVLDPGSSPEVAAARTASNDNPCSMGAREALTSAINAFVASSLGDHRDQIASIVIVGGDDIVPMAPVAQHTSQFTETSHAADLRLATTPTGGDCPVGAVVDPCETPLSAAAAASRILTDDPYGLATAYDSLGGHVYVPTVGLGRLAQEPAATLATIARFVDADGVLAADSTLTGGYGAWSELPQEVTDDLSWRSTGGTALTGDWDRSALEAALFPGTDAAPGQTAGVVSVNTHADETRMLPGVPGAEAGAFVADDLFLAAEHETQPQLSGSVIFGIGCHAGNNLPTSYYGAVTDWVDVFSQAGGYIGNTGYGLANNITTALSERLLSLYADWIGVQVDGTPVSAASALAFAKQSYLGGLGLYSGYDEKALMEAVYYGLPMYTFDAPAKEMPLPETPDLTVSTDGGLTTASLSFTPAFGQHSAADGSEYLTVDDQAPLAVAGQPVLPTIVRTLEQAPAGLTPHGVVLTALTSEFDTEGTPAVATPSVGVPEAAASRTGVAFPSTFGTITHQDTPDGPRDLLVLTPARVEIPPGGAARTERFTSFTAQVVYGDASSTDATPPSIDSVELPSPGRGEMEITVSDAGSGIASVILLVQPEGQAEWQRATVAPPTATSPAYRAAVPTTPFRWMLQVVDAAGNVAVDTARGRLDVAAQAAPALGDPGPDATVAVGDRLLRTVDVTDAVAGESLSAKVQVVDGGGTESTGDDEVIATSEAVVQTGPDGSTRVLIDQPVTQYGTYTVVLTACRSRACSSVSFALTTPPPNTAPIAQVTVTADTDPTLATSILTAEVTLTDADEDAVTPTYAWTRNGVAIPGQAGATLALADIGAQPGDVIEVTATPDDGKTKGHAASASMLVEERTPEPTIAVTATGADGGAYLEGSWSRTAVTVTFACGSLIGVKTCTDPVVVGDDTGPDGRTVTGTVTDVLGNTASVDLRVRVDRTAPALAPIVSPNPVVVGQTATATPNATDAGSGVSSASCDPPTTAVTGPQTVMCRATDVAGNTAAATAGYTVTVPQPPKCGGVLDRSPLLGVNTDGSSVFIRLSGVPIVFRACDAAGNSIGTKRFVTGVVLVATADLPSSARVNEAFYPPIGSFTYLKPAKTWVGAIPTLKLKSGKKYTYRIDLADGTSFTVTFGVR
ncbi:hypothetical protein [Microbacterium sp. NPDC058389]|uniref:hypothetical protein n=1 Tax=Microbacterium sp. NPDC058389 TaxID=3346475 RepID=UPI003668A076